MDVLPRRPLARAILLSALVSGAGAPSLRAQTPEAPATASLEVALRVTRLHGDTPLAAGAAALLGVGGRLMIGGSGWVILERSPIAEAAPGSGLELRASYGGLLADWLVAEGPRHRVSLRALVGAGNAAVSLPVVGTEIAADNFAVVEPEIVGDWRIRGPLSAAVAFSYRFVVGVEDLPGVAARDLRGLGGRVALTLRTF